MSRRLIKAAFIGGLTLFNSAAADADAGGNCGSAASAPVLPDASNENAPRNCDTGPIQQPEPTAVPPAPVVQPPGASEISPPPAPEPIPEPPPQQ